MSQSNGQYYIQQKGKCSNLQRCFSVVDAYVEDLIAAQLAPKWLGVLHFEPNCPYHFLYTVTVP